MTMVSVIIPVYNPREELFVACIESILAQSYDDYEVVIVDDGSNDSGKKLIDLQAKKIKNAHVIHKQNEGVSVARNLGVRLAKGKYITFVDDDDIIAPYMLCDAVEMLENKGLDIVYGYTRQVYNYAQTTFIGEGRFDVLDEYGKNLLYNHLLGSREKLFLEGKNYIGLGPWSKVIRKDIAVRVLFDKNLTWGEDQIWNIQLFQQLFKIGIYRELWYSYVQNEASVSHRYRTNAIEEYGKMLRVLNLYALNDEKKSACLKKTFFMIRELCKYYYFSTEHEESIVEGSLSFNKLINTYPWNYTMHMKIAWLSGWKTFFKYILVKTKLFYWLLAIKNSRK